MKKFFYAFLLIGSLVFLQTEVVMGAVQGDKALDALSVSDKSVQDKVSDLDVYELAKDLQVEKEKLELAFLKAEIERNKSEIENFQKELKKINNKDKKEEKGIVDKINGMYSSGFKAINAAGSNFVAVSTCAGNLILLTWFCLLYTRFTGYTPIDSGLGILGAVLNPLGSFAKFFAVGGGAQLVAPGFSLGGWLSGAPKLSPECALLVGKTTRLAELLKIKYGCA